MPKDKMVKAKTQLIVGDKCDLDGAIEKAVSLINRKLQSLSNLDPESLDGGELYKLSNSLAGLTRARSEHRKLDQLSREAFIQAGLEFKQRLRLELAKHPRLCEELIEVADAVHSQLE